MQINIHHHHHYEDDRFSDILGKLDTLMIDTSKLLAAVAAEKTESASLRALLAANTQAQRDSSAQITALMAQLAAGTPITAEQLAAIQTDIDNATNDLSTDNQAAADAVTANTIAPPPPATSTAS